MDTPAFFTKPKAHTQEQEEIKILFSVTIIYKARILDLSVLRIVKELCVI
jgi:hypothetical protein